MFGSQSEWLYLVRAQEKTTQTTHTTTERVVLIPVDSRQRDRAQNGFPDILLLNKQQIAGENFKAMRAAFFKASRALIQGTGWSVISRLAGARLNSELVVRV